MLKNKEFEKNCESSFKELDEKINEQIEKLKEIKKNYKNAFDDEKFKKNQFFEMINTTILNYKSTYENNNNNIILLNQLKKFEFDNNTNLSKKKDFKTNIKEIMINIPNDELPLLINYNFNFKNSINQNKKKEYKCIQTLYGHSDKIVSLYELNSKYLVSGSYDQTIKIWDLKNNECKRTIKERGAILSLLEFLPNILLCGTTENVINTYNINSKNDDLLFSFKGHILWVNCLVKLNKNYFSSCSNDLTIKIWNFNDKKCINTLKGHSDCILTMILLHDNTLCSGDAANEIKIWDWKNCRLLYNLTGHSKWVKCLLQLNDDIIISGSDDKTIKIWKDQQCITTIFGHNHSIRTLCKLNNEKFVSGSLDYNIKIWILMMKIVFKH